MDDLIDIFIKFMISMETTAKKEFEEYRTQRIDKASFLVSKLNSVVQIYRSKSLRRIKHKKIDALIEHNSEELSEMCLDFNAHEEFGHLYFFYKKYSQHYLIYSTLLNLINPKSSNSSVDTIQMLQFLKSTKTNKNSLFKPDIINQKWIKGNWKKFILQSVDNGLLKRFELFVSLKVALDLKTRDLYVEESNQYSDFRSTLISWKQYEKSAHDYCNNVGIPKNQSDFTGKIKNNLSTSCYEAEHGFQTTGKSSFKNGRLKISRVKAEEKPAELEKINAIINKHFKQIFLLDIIGQICKSLNLDLFFKDTNITLNSEEHLKQIIATLFCYGCNIDASEGEKSIVDINRRTINWVNTNHISEESLDRCSVNVVNVYNKFQLPKFWGDGKHVSVDGTKWDVYSKNLMAQFHIRYRGYGGIAYYHVSDKYIAIFSNFISCGVYEGRYLLDGLEQNSSDIKPEFVHGDSHAQSLVIFGLAYLLGIKIMPRIRNINELAFYKADKDDHYSEFNTLFKNKVINWKLIENNYHEMLRVALSIREGKVKASDILKKISANSAKNNLYISFRELGRAIRTTFLMDYIGNYDLRKIIHAATCKSEEFNEYVNWIAFADDTIKQNNRLQQKKFIKYNQLVTNMVLLYNVQAMSLAIKEARKSGIEIKEEYLRFLSPYRKSHIIRLGLYELDLSTYDKALLTWDFELSE